MTERGTDSIYMAALEWLVLMKDEKVGAEERHAFAAWLAADPVHAAAYARAQGLWDRFEIVRPEYERLRKAGSIRRRGLVGGLAMLIAGSGAYLLTRPGLLADYRTDIGERRSFTLGDGSIVELGSYSALSVDYTERERHLVLHHGEGFFRVAPNTGRPFIVSAAGGVTHALGTQFDVKLLDGLVTVSVLEHSVSVTVPAAQAALVEQGWQVSYGGDGLGPPRRADSGVIAAWRSDRIVFEDVPLRRVLRELERYRRGPIILMDDSIGDMPVTAIFETRQAEVALRTIAETLPIQVLNAGGLIAVVYRR